MSARFSQSFAFRTERFDYQSDLPADCNAGNRFYGRDVAEFLSRELSSRGFTADFMDEDWGWLVSGSNASQPGFQIAIYNLSDHREGGKPGANRWGLWISAWEKRKLLGLFAKNVEVEIPSALLDAIASAVQGLGTRLEPWDESESDD